MHTRIHQGTVASFDVERGLGTVADEEREWPFHCTAIADGSRRIDEGTAVSFRVIAAALGRWEATDITPRT